MIAPTQQDDQQARDALAYIRETMATASSFTAVSGWGLVGVGIMGLAAATVLQLTTASVIGVWVATAVICVAGSGAATAWKAQARKLPWWHGSFQKLAWVMTPPLVAGALVTGAAVMDPPVTSILQGIWLTLYGAAVTAGSTYSVREFRWMGMLFLALGAVALFVPTLGYLLMGVGFGGLHIAFGIRIARRYGG